MTTRIVTAVLAPAFAQSTPSALPDFAADQSGVYFTSARNAVGWVMNLLSRALRWTLVAGLCASSGGLAAADDPSKPASGYILGLGDIMTVVQLRHAKVWYAAQLGNWRLAAYELDRLDTSLGQAEQLFPDLPASATTAAELATDGVSKAIEAKDLVRFTETFERMTAACNTCHEAADRGFIVIRAPTRFSPYSNQMFERSGN